MTSGQVSSLFAYMFTTKMNTFLRNKNEARQDELSLVLLSGNDFSPSHGNSGFSRTSFWVLEAASAWPITVFYSYGYNDYSRIVT